MEKLITINSRKFDNSIHRNWQCKLLEETKEYWLFVGEFEKEVSHNKLGVIRRKTISYEYYFKEKWFNIFRFHEPEGQLKFYYCNINMPPIFENGVLDYVDLDIDVLVKKDFQFEILDEDEFIENSNKYEYPSSIQSMAKTNLHKLLEKIKKQAFPFNSIF
ncbi:MAG: DUF402 domain-containing protein [Acidobacteriota bacterium]